MYTKCSFHIYIYRMRNQRRITKSGNRYRYDNPFSRHLQLGIIEAFQTKVTAEAQLKRQIQFAVLTILKEPGGQKQSEISEANHSVQFFLSHLFFSSLDDTKFTEEIGVCSQVQTQACSASFVQTGQSFQFFTVVHAQGLCLPPESIITVYFRSILHVCFC